MPVHNDRSGNVFAELNAAGATVREYIWLPEAEIAPTAASRAQIDRPIAVVDGVNTATPATYYVHTDHLHRPIRMSNAAKAFVWSAEYQPWGAVQSLSGALTLDLRFPGQWFQLEAGLHYNWHRHYDASLGRYTQPDPLGFVDGPSVFGYAGGSPYRSVDPEGRYWWLLTPAARCAANPSCRTVVINYCKRKLKEFWKDEHGGSRKAPNQTANKQAADALAEAARRQNRELTRQLERDWHDHITGEGFEGYQELLQEALQWLLEQ